MSSKKVKIFWGWTSGTAAKSNVDNIGGFVDGVAEAVSNEDSLGDGNEEFMDTTTDASEGFANDNSEQLNKSASNCNQCCNQSPD